MDRSTLHGVRRAGYHGAAALLVLALAVVLRDRAPAAAPAHAGETAVTLVAWFDFARDDPRSVELSGIAWDAATRTLVAISDDTPQIVPIRPGADGWSWTFGEPIPVDVPEQWDGEGIAVLDGGFAIANEVGPRIFLLDRDGRMTGEVPLPDHFRRILSNRSLESLAVSPDGRFLFTANETALDGDGPQPSVSNGTTVRILRVDRAGAGAVEYAYRTDPVFAPGDGGGVGVVDMAALSDGELLVMERHFVPMVGNAVRIYRVGLSGAANVLDVAQLSEQTPVLPKTLVVDLAELPDDAVPPPRQPQPNRLLDNFEGLALGPLLPDGRRLLYLISDDNGTPTQTPRLLVLAVAGLEVGGAPARP